MEPGAPRILISRLSAIGDCIATLPLLCALRAAFPSAMIAWIVEQAAAPLLRGHACLDELIVVPKRWLKSPQTILAVRRQLRDLKIDVSLDPQSLTKSGLAARLSGARQRIGFRAPRGRELSTWLNNQLVAPRASHIVDAQLELLSPLGIERPEIRFDVPHDDTAECRAQAVLRERHLMIPFAVLNVGAGWLSRLWPPARYGRVAKFLGVTRGTPSLIVWNGEQERQWAEQAAGASGGHAFLAPSTSLPELAAILRRAKLYVGSDTGPMHLAAAVGTPCVALFGTTRPENSGPYGSQHLCLQQYFQNGTSRQRRRMANDAMREITVESVCDACQTLLGPTGKGYCHARSA